MSDRLKLNLVILLLIAAMFLCFQSAKTVQQDDNGSAAFVPKPAATSEVATNFTLPTAQTGTAVTLQAEDKRHPVLLDFWATWCGPCRAELPSIAAVARKYRGQVAVYGVNFSDSPAAIVAFSKANHLPFPTLVDSQHLAANAYGAGSIPHLVLIDTQNRVRLSVTGFDPGANIKGDLSKDLNSVLAGNSST